MYISPINIIKGLKLIVETNIDQINDLLQHYRKSDTLHVFEGLRKTLPLSAYPSLEFEPSSSTTEWTTTSAQTGEYTIDCYLTVNNSNEDLNAEYISEVTRKIVKLFNFPTNMCFPIPNEFFPDGSPIYVQFGNIQSVTYRSTRDGSLTVAQFSWTGRVLEPFILNGLIGPSEVNWKEDKKHEGT